MVPPFPGLVVWTRPVPINGPHVPTVQFGPSPPPHAVEGSSRRPPPALWARRQATWHPPTRRLFVVWALTPTVSRGACEGRGGVCRVP